MSGPTRLNFATFPTAVPCPMSTTISVSFAVTRCRSAVNAAVTPSRVAAAVPVPVSVKDTT